MRPVCVVVLEVLLQHRGDVVPSDEEKVIEAFAAEGADPTLSDRVRPSCLGRCADDPDVRVGEHGVEGGGERAVSVADQEPKR